MKLQIRYEAKRITSKKPLLFKDYKQYVLDDDELYVGYDEGHSSENEQWDSHYYVEIFRVREETDKEYEERKRTNEYEKNEQRKRRYERYLELKKEFEVNLTIPDEEK